MIKVTQKGNLSKTYNFLKNAANANHVRELHKYGQMGVDALSANTPIDTGKTSESWYYTITETATGYRLNFNNSNITPSGCPIAIILQYGHGTGTGGWVEGRDYINPAIQPIFDELAETLWREVTKK